MNYKKNARDRRQFAGELPLLREMEATMIVYGLKSCDACRKAVKELGQAGHEAELVDIRATPLDNAQRARFLAAFGEALVNRRSTTWRELSEAERETTPAVLLAAHPTLMKRPVIERGEALYLGWDATVRSELL